VYCGLILLAILTSAYLCRRIPGEIVHHFKLARLERECVANPLPEGIIVYDSQKPQTAITSVYSAKLHFLEMQGFPYHIRPALGETGATIFVGELKRPDGTTRLVDIEARVSGPSVSVPLLTIRSFSFDPRLIWQDELVCTGPDVATAGRLPMPKVVIHSATRDPNDPSHISFHYQVDTQQYLVDGYLTEARFTLKQREQPLP
jgi:hypothetical protein